jgi:L-ribulose-5-phosphate 3-epimerase
MRKAIVIRAFSGNPDFLGSGTFLTGQDDFARCFDRARNAGFEGVELFLDSTGYLSLKSSSTVATGIAQAARQASITITSLEIAPFSYLFTSDDPDTRRHADGVVRQSLRIAATMEVDGVLVIPGYVGLPWDSSAPVVHYERAYERTRDGLAALVPEAERLGVSILLENVWNKFLLSPLEMRRMLDEIGSPRVRALLDVGNIVLFGYPEQWIDILGTRIQEVHLKDYRQAVGTVVGMVGLLEGDVNWPAVVQALRAIHYDGFLTAEVFPYSHAPDLIIEHTSRSIDEILAL